MFLIFSMVLAFLYRHSYIVCSALITITITIHDFIESLNSYCCCRYIFSIVFHRHQIHALAKRSWFSLSLSFYRCFVTVNIHIFSIKMKRKKRIAKQCKPTKVSNRGWTEYTNPNTSHLYYVQWLFKFYSFRFGCLNIFIPFDVECHLKMKRIRMTNKIDLLVERNAGKMLLWQGSLHFIRQNKK